MDTVFILGPDSPCMRTIQKILMEQDEIFFFAAVDGQRCGEANADKCNGFLLPDGTFEQGGPINTHIILVRCGFAEPHPYAEIGVDEVGTGEVAGLVSITKID